MNHTINKIRYVAWEYDPTRVISTWWPADELFRDTFEEAEADAKAKAARRPGAVWMIMATMAMITTPVAPPTTTKFMEALPDEDSSDP